MTESLDSTREAAWRAYIEASQRLFTQLEDDLRADSDLSFADYHVLVVLSEAPGQRLRMGELASRLVFSPSRLTYQISSMQRRGLVSKEACPDDRRGSEAVLTATGLLTLSRSRTRTIWRRCVPTSWTTSTTPRSPASPGSSTASAAACARPAPRRPPTPRVEGAPSMPAITVDDVLVLPRLPRLDESTSFRPVRRLTTAPSGFEGEGFPVRRAFAGVPMTELDPFIHLDQMGEVDYAPGEPKGTPWHPHRGFETVTYMIDGIFDHQDSHGGGGTITDGDTQWMTAGSGLLHIEAPPEHLVPSGGLFHGLQLWVNLPRAAKMIPPRYQDIRGRESALLTTPDGGALIRVIAGEVAGHRGPGSTFTPITLAHVTAAARRAARPALAARLQRAGLRAGRARHGRRRPAADAHRSARRARPGRRAAGQRRRRRRTATPRRWSSTSWAASRSGSRWRTTARS